eukprot:519455-Hanusia_phi.AAC.4
MSNMVEEAERQQMRLRNLREKMEKSRAEAKRIDKKCSSDDGPEEGLETSMRGDGGIRSMEGSVLERIKESIGGNQAKEQRVLRGGLRTSGMAMVDTTLEGATLTYRMVLEMEMNEFNRPRLQLLARDGIRRRRDQESEETEESWRVYGASRSTYGRFLSRKLLPQGESAKAREGRSKAQLQMLLGRLPTQEVPAKLCSCLGPDFPALKEMGRKVKQGGTYSKSG